MIPEFGILALIIAFILALTTSCLSFSAFSNSTFSNQTRITALCLGQCFFVALAFFILIFTFLSNDFSVEYVFLHSHSALPLIYKIGALWGGHEGSFLLWIFIFNLWLLYAVFSSDCLENSIRKKMIAILSLLSAGFIAFLLLTSNPFTRLLPNYPFEGRDLNPVLQDMGMMFHPPLLYLGYVGFALPFAFALALLLNTTKNFNFQANITDITDSTKINEPTLRWLKRSIILPWSFLALGITLGSFWAYYELGWGGWWFWDPVENASFLPWLVGTALVHNVLITIKRSKCLNFTIFLCLLTFCLSLLGTFLVRSGILTSVHAFANDPDRGVFLLILLSVIILGAFTLYGFRAKYFYQTDTLQLSSRESLLFINAVLLLIVAASIFLGTFFPLLYEQIYGTKISVGFPYYNAVFIPLVIPILLLMPMGTTIKWQAPSLKNAGQDLIDRLRWPFLFSLLLTSFLVIYYQKYNFFFALGLLCAFWIVLGTVVPKLTTPIYFIKHLGVLCAHLGVAILVIGVTVVSQFEIEREVQMSVQDTVDLGTYKITFLGMNVEEGPNYIGMKGCFRINEDTYLYPEKRIFVAQNMPVGETALDGGFFRDIYIALGEELSKNTWSVRLYYKPFVRWIWLGGILMALGGFFAFFKRKKTGGNPA